MACEEWKKVSKHRHVIELSWDDNGQGPELVQGAVDGEPVVGPTAEAVIRRALERVAQHRPQPVSEPLQKVRYRCSFCGKVDDRARYSAILAAVALPRQKAFSSSAFSARLSTLRQSSCQEGNLGIGKPGTCERANGAQAEVGDPARVRLRFEARGKAP